MLDDGPEGQAGQEVQRADQQHGAQQQDHEGDAGDREGAGAGRGDFLLRRASRPGP